MKLADSDDEGAVESTSQNSSPVELKETADRNCESGNDFGSEGYITADETDASLLCDDSE